MSSLFRAYDVRGKVPQELNEEVMEQIGRAFGRFLDVSPVVVGRDIRNHSFSLFQAFSRGLNNANKKVIDIGQVPTPLVAYWMRKRGYDGGAMITASHNPQNYNGVKFRGERGKAFTWEGGIKRIKALYQQLDSEAEKDQTQAAANTMRQEDPLPSYVEDMVDNISLSQPIKVVLDCSNGTAGLVAPQLFEKAGIETINLNETPDGNFPAHPPVPTNQQAVKAVSEKVTESEADLGIIYDGDSDRAIFIDDRGDLVSSDQSLMLLAEEQLRKKGEGKILVDITMSQAVSEYVRSLGGQPLVSRTGNSYFAEKIDEDDSILVGGEHSGHIFLPALGVPYDDGLFASLAFSAIVSQLDSLKERRKKLPAYHTSQERRVPCPETEKELVVNKVKEHFRSRWQDVIELDGIKVMLKRGWFLLRPSNTEPKLSLRAEAKTKQEMESIRDEVLQEIERYT